MRRLLVTTVIGTTLASTCLASAAALGGVRGEVAAGNAPITTCDTNGFTVTYTTSGGNVTAVTVGGIGNPGCEGADLTATVTDAGGTRIASGGGPIPTDGDTADDTMTVLVDPNPAAEQVSGYHIAIVGP